MSLQTLIIRYTVFAVIATFMNLFFQRVILLIDNSFPYFITAVAVGTLVGLVVKYYLDKRWIFLIIKRVCITIAVNLVCMLRWGFSQRPSFGDLKLYFG